MIASGNIFKEFNYDWCKVGKKWYDLWHR